MRLLCAIAFSLSMLFPGIALAADGNATPLVWWQIGAGILALPTGALGLVYSFFQIQKTRLEIRKIGLELHEKERKVGAGIDVTVATSARRIRLIAVYLLLATGFIGAYPLIFSETWLFPVTFDEQRTMLVIMLPVFSAQLTLPFLWTSRQNIVWNGGGTLFWPVAAPIAATGLFAVATLAFVLTNSAAAPPGEGLSVSFIETVTALCVTVINIATIRIIAAMTPPNNVARTGGGEIGRVKARSKPERPPLRKS